ncbi:MAG: YjjG family noncanonical pyrimidine nucleotidase [Chitinophagales bacterium]|nr:YjjG family noncanonical pyrimidine nucleotidase [Chitinophagales bacterium]
MISTKKYKHVFFDLDETLWDFKRNSLETLHELFVQHQFEERGIEKEKFFERYHYHNNIYWDLFRKGEVNREELRTVRWINTLNEFDIEDAALSKNLSDQYLHLLPSKKNLFEDTIEILEYLKPKYSIHIITNGFEEVQLRKIEISGMAPYFTHIITSERACSAKPNREIFLYAFDVTGATVRNSIFIGDSIDADIKGAQQMGMDHVLFNPESLPHQQPVMMEIESLIELKSIL